MSIKMVKYISMVFVALMIFPGFPEVRGNEEPFNNMIDLAVEDIWFDENLTVSCRIASLDATYTGNFYVNLTVNNKFITSDIQMMSVWVGWMNVTFQYRIPWEGESVEVMVNIFEPQWPADNDTTNDERTEVWERDLPDLWVTSVFTDQVSGNATALVENHGESPVTEPFNTRLEVNGSEKDEVTTNKVLGPGDSVYVDLGWHWDRSVEIVNIVVKTDCDNDINEIDESDNEFSITWNARPDLYFTTQPSLFYSDPISALINWSTSIPVYAVLHYGTSSDLETLEYFSDVPMTSGQFYLSALESSTLYIYKISVEDVYGRSLDSNTLSFTTDEETGTSEINGSFASEMMMDLEGTVEIPFESSDPKGIKKLDIYIDGKLKKSVAGLKKSKISGVMMDMDTIAPGNHTMMIKVTNRFGETSHFGSEMRVQMKRVERFPKVEFDPSSGDKSGTVFFYARCTDPVGITNVTWYVNGEEAHYQTPISSVRTFFGATFNWDSTEVYDGEHVVSVVARNDDGNASTVVRHIDVRNHVPPADPNVGVTRLNMRRTGSVVTQELRVGNWGAGAAINIYIEDIMKGFVPVDDDMDSYSWTDDGRIWVAQLFIDRLDPGEIITVDYKCVPALLSEEDEHILGFALNYPGDDTMDPVTTAIRYRREDLAIRYLKTRNLPPTQFVPSGAFMATGAEEAIGYADYMLLTTPYRLEDNYGESQMDDIILTASHLAAEKHGVLGFMVGSTWYSPTLTTEDVYTQLQEWAPRLNPYFIDFGYLAIIGENNIVPAFTYEDVVHFRGEDDPRDVPLSDHGYMNLEGGSTPKIAVGRFIGATSSEIMAPMEVSLEEARGTLVNDHEGDALLLSGAGNSVQSFKNHLANLHFDLGRNMDDVGFVEKSPSLVERLLSHQFSGNPDQLAAGNLDHDDRGEIVITPLGYSAYVIADTGIVTDFYHYIQDGDVVLCGDVAGDDRDEIIFVEVGTRGGRARAYNKAGTEQATISIPWEIGDPICAEDYNGDGKDELIMASASSDEVIVFDAISGEIDRFSVADIRPDDHIGLTDMDADGDLDVVIGDINDDKVRVYLAPTRTRFDINCNDLDENDAFAVGVYSGNRSGGRVFVLHPDIDGHTNEIYMSYDADEDEWLGKSEKCYMTTVADRCAAVITEFIGNGDYGEVVVVERGPWNNIQILDYAGCASRFRTEIAPHMDELDLIVYSDHGYTRGWGGTYHFDQVPGWGMNTWTHRPVIYSAACSTGDYTATDDSMAVTCLREGAAVFIGATQTSQISENNLAMQFVETFSTGVPIGVAFKNYKASLVAGDFGIDSWASNLWAYQYNLYGDPAFGTPTGAVPARGMDQLPTRNNEPIIYKIEEPVFLNHTGEKEVLLEGNLVTREDGEPSLPYIRKLIDIPLGSSIANISVTPLGPWEYYYDLDVRNYVMGEFADQNKPTTGTWAITDPEGSWMPENHYQWSFETDMGENGTLVVDFFPFHYDEYAMVGRFCSSWELDYDLVSVPAWISELHGPPGISDPGMVTFNATIEPIGNGGTVFISQRIEYISGDPPTFDPGELPDQIIDINTSMDLSQDWSFDGDWGRFLYVLELLSQVGGVIDVAYWEFGFGAPDLKIYSFNVSDEVFDENSIIHLSLEIENDGEMDTEGVLEVDLLGSDPMDRSELLRENITIGSGGDSISREMDVDMSLYQGDTYQIKLGYTDGPLSVSRIIELSRNGTVIPEEERPGLVVEYHTTNRSFYEEEGIWIYGSVHFTNQSSIPGVGVGAWIGENGTSSTELSDEFGQFSLYLGRLEPGEWNLSILVSAGDLQFTDTFPITVWETVVIPDDDDDDDDIVDDDDVVDDDDITPDDDDVTPDDDDITPDDDDITPDDDVAPDDDTTPDDDDDDTSNKGTNWALIGGIIVAIVLILIAIIITLVLMRRYKEEEMDWDDE